MQQQESQRAPTPAPVIVMAHGLGGTRSMGLEPFAEAFQREGYGCLVFDYRYFGDSTGRPRNLVRIKDQLDDWRAALACVRAEPRVDGSRVVAWGTSLSGGHVLTLGAESSELAGIIANCPFTSGIASSLATHPASAAKMALPLFRDLVVAVNGGSPVTIPVVAPPRQLGLMTKPDSEPGYQRLARQAGVESVEVPARAALEIMRYNPAGGAAEISTPTLVVAATDDTATPIGPTLKAAAKMADSEVFEISAGHFDIYVDDHFEINIAHQLDWLRRRVPIRT